MNDNLARWKLIFLPPIAARNRFWRLGLFCVLFVLVLASPVRAQDHTVLFSTTDPGVTRAITNWGMGTIGGYDVM